MSDTPRTEAMMEAARPVSWQASYGKAVELCRELERELTSLKKTAMERRDTIASQRDIGPR